MVGTVYQLPWVGILGLPWNQASAIRSLLPTQRALLLPFCRFVLQPCPTSFMLKRIESFIKAKKPKRLGTAGKSVESFLKAEGRKGHSFIYGKWLGG